MVVWALAEDITELARGVKGDLKIVSAVVEQNPTIEKKVDVWHVNFDDALLR